VGKDSAYSTRPADVPARKWRADVWARRFIVAVLCLILGAAVLGWLGTRRATVSASGQGYRLIVDYTSISRAGLSSPWNVEVHHPGGFDGPIAIATTQEYFTIFDENGLFPEPSKTTSKGELVLMEFDPPEGEVLSIHLDTRIEPSVHSGESARTQLIVGGAVVAEVEYTTTVMP
jgi:hypothetical protein